MIYGYARVSSKGQAKDGNSLEAQSASLLSHGCEEVLEEAYTGMTADRPVFSKILGKIKKGDTLVVTKLDRLSRSAVEGVKIIQKLHEEGVIVEILNMGRVDYTPMGKLMVTMLLAFAEFEHDNIVERLSEGKSVAKAKGKKVDGRYRKIPKEFDSYLALVREEKITVAKACEELGIGKTTWLQHSQVNGHNF